jgi:hypothetical protein
LRVQLQLPQDKKGLTVLTRNKLFSFFMLTDQWPGFMTRGDGMEPDGPDTVVKTGSRDGLNCTKKFCSMSLGLSGVIVMAPTIGSGFGFL